NKHTFLFPAFSGDGGAVGLAANVGAQQFAYASSQLGTIRRASLPNFSSSTLIRPTGLTANPGGGFGEFVTIFKLNPSNTEDLYYVNFGRLFRTTNASTVTSSTGWSELTGIAAAVDPTINPGTGRYIRALAFSWGPYQASHAMYIGTTDGRIFRFDNPRNALAGTAPVNISIPGLPSGANIQDIAVNPNDDNEIMAVVSNYEISNANVVSVWWTNNAKSATPTWRNAEGDLLTSVSARSCAIVVKRDGSNNPVTEYYVGTSVGLFSAINIGPTLIGAGSVTWFREGATVMGMPVVQSLAYRPVDNVLLVGTHGNGMYFTYLGTPNYTPNSPTPVSNTVLNDKNFINAVFPTVSNGRVDFRIGNLYSIKRMNVQLYSANGALVYNNAMGYQNGSVDLNRLSRGTYVLSITSDDGKYKHLQKIIRN
ncbi:MAG: T9SS type A sorting domain-containing protein, partial [Chitinophagaceae bacterium]